MLSVLKKKKSESSITEWSWGKIGWRMRGQRRPSVMGSGKFSHDADEMRLLRFYAKMSKYTDGIIERRILFYSAYFAPPWDLKRNQKKKPLSLVVYTPVVCSGAVRETGGVTGPTLRAEQKRSTRFSSGLSSLSRRLQHIQ